MAEPWAVHELVKHYTYDGLGRLIRTQSPEPDPDTSDDSVRSERFYYDGLRRILEVETYPLANLAKADPSGDAYEQALYVLYDQHVGTGGNLDEAAAPIVYELGQLGSSAPTPPGASGPPEPELVREYIWGPGDGLTDELLAQFASDDTGHVSAWWVIQDGGGDVVALADLGGSGDSARVVAQWTYDAYGAVLTADHLHSHDLVRAGHKGLFVDRLDEGVSDGTQDTPRLIPDAHLLVHMRNRTYMPGHGRFLQRDPNATAQVLMDNASWFHGGAAVAALSTFDLQDHYGYGANPASSQPSLPSGSQFPQGRPKMNHPKIEGRSPPEWSDARTELSALPWADLVNRYAIGVERFSTDVLRLDDDQLDTALLPDAGLGRWPVRVVLGHLADAELVLTHRMRRIVAEDGPLLAEYDHDAFIDAGLYAPAEGTPPPPIAPFIAVIHTTRAWTAQWLATLAEDHRRRQGMHPAHGPQTVRDILHYTTWHLERHAWFANAKAARLLADAGPDHPPA